MIGNVIASSLMGITGIGLMFQAAGSGSPRPTLAGIKELLIFTVPLALGTMFFLGLQATRSIDRCVSLSPGRIRRLLAGRDGAPTDWSGDRRVDFRDVGGHANVRGRWKQGRSSSPVSFGWRKIITDDVAIDGLHVDRGWHVHSVPLHKRVYRQRDPVPNLPYLASHSNGRVQLFAFGAGNEPFHSLPVHCGTGLQPHPECDPGLQLRSVGSRRGDGCSHVFLRSPRIDHHARESARQKLEGHHALPCYGQDFCRSNSSHNRFAVDCLDRAEHPPRIWFDHFMFYDFLPCITGMTSSTHWMKCHELSHGLDARVKTLSNSKIINAERNLPTSGNQSADAIKIIN